MAQAIDQLERVDKPDKAEKIDKVDAASKGAAVVDISAKVDPAKKAAIKELLELTRMSENYGAIRDVMLAQVRRTVNSVLQKSINEDSHYSESQKKHMLDTLSDSSDRIISRYRELSVERINMTAVMEQVAYKVYDESFTTSELHDLITFYRTPTGQKAMKEMPEIMHRSMTLSSQLIQTKILEIIKELVSEEFGRLKQDVTSASASTTGSGSASGSTSPAAAGPAPTTPPSEAPANSSTK